MENKNFEKTFINRAKILLKKYYDSKCIRKNTYTLNDIYPDYFDHIQYDTVFDDFEEIEDLGKIYEDSIPYEKRKDYGQFYTNDKSVISRMVDDIDVLSGRILEPSCGSGLFVIEIIDKIYKKLYPNNDLQTIINYTIDNICINDLDPFATQITELRILSYFIDSVIGAVNNGNDIKIPKINMCNVDFIKKGVFKGFDVVIGNPPFVTMYGKRSRNMSEDKREYFNTFNFVQNKKGNNKFNVSMFFVENGLESLNDNGILYYVLDISFFETAFIDLRKYILNNYCICSITNGLSEFEGVASGQILLKLKNKKIANNYTKWIDYDTGEVTNVLQDSWLIDSPKYRIRKPLNLLSKNINEKINKGRDFCSLFPGKSLRTCCALTGKTEEFLVDESFDECEKFPYLEGSKGLKKKFALPTPTNYIKYDYDLQLKISEEFKIELEKQGIKNKKRVTLGDPECYRSPKLFIRQSAKELIATYTEKPFAANNSLYVLSLKSWDKNDKDLLKYFCGLFNSDLMTFFALTNKIIRMEKGKTPQIKISDLMQIKIIIDSNYEKVVEIVDSLLKHPDSIELINALNACVYKIYGINNEEQNYIKNNI